MNICSHLINTDEYEKDFSHAQNQKTTITKFRNFNTYGAMIT